MPDLGPIKLEEVLEAVMNLYASEDPIFLNDTLLDIVLEHRKSKESKKNLCKKKGHDWYLNTLTGKIKCIYCGIFKP